MRDFRGRAVGKAGSLRRAVLAALLLPWILSTTGCLFSNAKPTARAFRPPPVEAKAVVVIPEVPILEEAGPPVDGPEPVPNPSEIATIRFPDLPKGPELAPAKPHTPAPVKATAPAPAPTPPVITQAFTQEQSDELNHSYNEFLGQVRRDLAVLDHRRLGADQSVEVSQIRTFEKQAEQEHNRDLVTAVELARRAASLAADLVSRVR
jgi:hypothetical protein